MPIALHFFSSLIWIAFAERKHFKIDKKGKQSLQQVHVLHSKWKNFFPFSKDWWKNRHIAANIILLGFEFKSLRYSWNYSSSLNLTRTQLESEIEFYLVSAYADAFYSWTFGILVMAVLIENYFSLTWRWLNFEGNFRLKSEYLTQK